MHWKKLLIAFIAAFVFLFFFGFIWYGMLMQSAHHEVPTLLRPEADFKRYFPCLVLGHLVMAFFFTVLCVRFVPGGGLGATAAFGILVGLLYAGPHLISFAVQPLTPKIFGGWTLGAIIQFTIAGAIIGAIYKPAPAHVTFVKERPR
ncbi:MAG TPA: hypothetical protein VH254_06800 [Candidatus Udaeobacter sp.]|nr:hypothetical protein [Candidatus Udaeobacter sp.]